MADIMDMRKRREERRQAALIAAESQLYLVGSDKASAPVLARIATEKNMVNY